MKIRWTAGSIRLRISPSELTALQEGRGVEERLQLSLQEAWGAVLEAHSGKTEIALKGGTLRISLSPNDLAALSAPEVEGVYFGGEGSALRYFIEKDFPCAHPRPAQAQEAEETFAPTADFARRKRTGG